MTGESATGDPTTGDPTTGERKAGETTTAAPESDVDGPRPDSETGSLARLETLLASDRDRLVVAVGTVAFVAVTVRTVVHILANLPFDPVVASPAVRSVLAVVTPVIVALALATVALTDDRAPVRVGLLFAAVFGVLGLVAPAATLPAVVAVAGGAGLGLLGALGLPADPSAIGGPDGWTYQEVRRRVIVTGFTAAIAISLADAIGIVTGLRGVGALFALVSLATVGTRSEGSSLAAAAGVLAAATVVYVSATSPYVVGAALLVAFAVTGVPHLLVALAVAGGVAATVAGIRRGEYALAVGAGILLSSGVPASLPRAMAVLLGVALVGLEWDDSASTEVAT